MHAKYEISISYGSTVVAKVKLTTDKQIEQKQIEYASDLSTWGQKLCICDKIVLQWDARKQR